MALGSKRRADFERSLVTFDKSAFRTFDSFAEAEDADAERTRLVAEYEERFANPYIAAARGYVDEVILPSETRARVAGALHMLENKRQTVPPKKHGNIPL